MSWNYVRISEAIEVGWITMKTGIFVFGLRICKIGFVSKGFSRIKLGDEWNECGLMVTKVVEGCLDIMAILC